MFIDSHCHLSPFDPEKLRLTLDQAAQAGVQALVSMGQNLETSAGTVDLHMAEDSVWAGVGIHPWHAVPVDQEVYQRLLALAEKEGVVAIGEVGLDSERGVAQDIQLQALTAQLRLARDLGLPISVHCRGAHHQMLDILSKEWSGVGGIIHNFGGDAAELKAWLDRGFYVGVGYRSLVRPGGDALRKLIGEVPLERLALETDASYKSAWGDDAEGLTPSHVRQVAEMLAQDRGLTLEEIGRATTANVKRLLRLGG